MAEKKVPMQPDTNPATGNKVVNDYGKAREWLPFILLNSTVLFLLSFLIVYLLNQLISKAGAAFFGIGSSIRYYEIYFKIPIESTLWTPVSISLVTSAGPVLLMITGAILLFVIIKRVPFSNYNKIFIFWIGYQSVNLFLGGIIAGAVTGRGLGYPMDLAFYPILMVYIFLILVSVFFLILFGYNYCERYLKISPLQFWMKRRYRKHFLIAGLVLPWFFGSVILSLLRNPNRIPQHDNIVLHDIVLSFSMIFLLIGMLLYDKPFPVKPSEISDEDHPKVLWKYLIITVVSLIIFRVLV